MNELYCCGCGKPLADQPTLVENNPDMCVCETCLAEIRKLMSSSQHSAAATDQIILAAGSQSPFFIFGKPGVTGIFQFRS